MLQAAAQIPGRCPAGELSATRMSAIVMTDRMSYALCRIAAQLHVLAFLELCRTCDSADLQGLAQSMLRVLRLQLSGVLMKNDVYCLAAQVDNASISAAIKDVFNETRTILEPAGAVGVAGVKAYLKARPELKVGSCQYHVPLHTILHTPPHLAN